MARQPWQATLFVAGNSPASLRARSRLEGLLQEFGQQIMVEIVDVFEAPQRARSAGVLLTPLLLVEGDGEPLRIAGDLADVVLLEQLRRLGRSVG